MKRSEIYHLAMKAVLDVQFPKDTTLAILKVLIEDENMALFTEEREEKQEAMKNAETV